MDEDKTKERFEQAKKEISEVWNNFYADTGFFITDIGIKIIEESTRCGKAVMLTTVDLKITR